MSQTPPYNDLFNMLGLSSLPEAKKAELFEKMQDLVNDRVTARILSMMTDMEADEFMELETEEETTKFLEKKNIDAVAIAAEEALGVREDVIRDISIIDGKLGGQQ